MEMTWPGRQIFRAFFCARGAKRSGIGFKDVIMSDTWEAHIRLKCEKRHGRTVLTENEHEGPLVVQKVFYPEETAHVYLLHPPGGIAGCDRLVTELRAENDSRVLLTTPGATKYYRTAGDLVSRVRQDFYAGAGAELEILPQPNIYFLGTHTKVSTVIHAAETGRVIFWDTAVVGSPVGKTGFEGSFFLNSVSVCRIGADGAERTLLREVSRVDGRRDLNARAGLRGRQCIGTLIASSGSDEAASAAREILNGFPDAGAGVTTVSGLLAVRLLSEDNETVTSALRALWTGLRPVILGKAPVPPRVWAT